MPKKKYDLSIEELDTQLIKARERKQDPLKQKMEKKSEKDGPTLAHPMTEMGAHLNHNTNLG